MLRTLRFQAFVFLLPFLLQVILIVGSHPVEMEDFENPEDSNELEIYQGRGGPRKLQRKKRGSLDYSEAIYRVGCVNSLKLEPNMKVSLISMHKGKQNYPGGLTCGWEVIGLWDCIPAVSCPTIDVRKSSGDKCTDDFSISDGAWTYQKFCGENMGFSHYNIPKKSSYLFIDFRSGDSTHFDRIHKGIECKVHCTTSKQISTAKKQPLPDAVTLKEEYKRVCGKQFDEGKNRIVGGEVAKKSEFPWQVVLTLPNSRSPFCGGTLINDRIVVTAAHCVMEDSEPIGSNELEILLNAHLLDQSITADADLNAAAGMNGSIKSEGWDAKDDPSSRKDEIRVGVEEIIVHPLYDYFISSDCDIALLRLKTKLSFKDDLTPTPACLPDVNQPYKTYVGAMATVSGWGKADYFAGASTRILMKVEVPVISSETCKSWYEEQEITISDNMLCAGFEGGKKDACSGDSGGPLVTKDGDKFVLIGVVSFGWQCARARRPGVYARVTEFLPWIYHHSRGSIWARSP